MKIQIHSFKLDVGSGFLQLFFQIVELCLHGLTNARNYNHGTKQKYFILTFKPIQFQAEFFTIFENVK